MNRTTIERRLAEFALGFKFEEVPAEIVTITKRLLLDALGCALGATASEPARIVEHVMREHKPGASVATVIGGRPASAEIATYVNGVLVRYLDFNDFYVGSDPLHPSEIIPLAMATCEEAGGSGRDLIAAIVAGYETLLRINDAVGFLRRGFHPLSAAAFVAPLVAAKILGLSVDTAAHAVGISGTRGLTMFVVNKGDISMMKAMGHAWSCADGLLAARLAARGFTGPTGTLDWVAHALQPSQARLDIDLRPSAYRIPFVGVKRFPVQYEIQGAAEAAVALHRRNPGKIGRITRVEIRTTKQALARLATPDRYRPGTREAADHSLPVCVAMALRTGDISAAHFDDGVWQRADVLDLAQRIECRAEPGRTSHSRGASVFAQFDNGHIDVETIAIPEGDAERPMEVTDLEAKFISLAAASVGHRRALEIIELIGRLEDIEHVSTFTRLFQVMEFKSN